MRTTRNFMLPNAFAFAFALLALTSCASLPGDALVGRWNALDGTGNMVLSRDGTITAIDRDKSVHMLGTYKVVGENKVRFESNGKDPDFKSVVATVVTSNNELTMTNPDGKVYKYKRVE